MIGDRARGALLYATAAALVAGGAVWWVAAAPGENPETDVDRWRATAERLLPDRPEQAGADTMTFASGDEQQVDADVPVGSYQVSVVCVGGPGTTARVTLSQGGNDSGRGLSCEGDPKTDTFAVALAGGLQMNVVVSEGAGPVVFRYALTRRPN